VRFELTEPLGSTVFKISEQRTDRVQEAKSGDWLVEHDDGRSGSNAAAGTPASATFSPESTKADTA
jgi:hypothetical protein